MFLSGKGKLLDLDKPTAFFQNLGIPFPHANAILVAGIECFGGILIMVGLVTRVTSLTLAVIMAVAIGTAQWAEVKDLGDFVFLSEVAYCIIFLWLVTAGPGKASVDHWICRRPPTATPPSGLS